MSQEVVIAVGRRKSAVARVYLKSGNGTITINQRSLEEYIPLDIFRYVVKQPLILLGMEDKFDININLKGGGIKGQSEAARLGIARCLNNFDEQLRPALKKEGFLTRDARVVERKKPGRPGARKRFQFSKR